MTPTDFQPDAQPNWTAVLAEQQSWLRAVIVARLGSGLAGAAANQADACDDVWQEVLLAVCKQATQEHEDSKLGAAPLKDPSKVAPWLYRVTVRQCLLYRRKAGRTRKLIKNYAESAAVEDTSSGDPLPWLLDNERKTQVREAMQRLPAADREILMLKYSQDWNYTQIAEHLGVSHSAVETRLFRARRKLRQLLTEKHVSVVD